LIVPNSGHIDRKADKDRELATLMFTFWQEDTEFMKKYEYFADPHMWYTAEDDTIPAHEWHMNFSHPYMKVFGKLA
jgi:hypothetical protein